VLGFGEREGQPGLAADRGLDELFALLGSPVLLQQFDEDEVPDDRVFVL